MQLNTQTLADALVVAPRGRIDHENAAALEAQLLPLLREAAQRHSPVVLDLAGIDYISSVGLRVLMIAAQQMRAAGAALNVAALQGVVAEIFKISRFDKVLPVHATLADALAAHRAARPAASP